MNNGDSIITLARALSLNGLYETAFTPDQLYQNIVRVGQQGLVGASGDILLFNTSGDRNGVLTILNLQQVSSSGLDSVNELGGAGAERKRSVQVEGAKAGGGAGGRGAEERRGRGGGSGRGAEGGRRSVQLEITSAAFVDVGKFGPTALNITGAVVFPGDVQVRCSFLSSSQPPLATIFPGDVHVRCSWICARFCSSPLVIGSHAC